MSGYMQQPQEAEFWANNQEGAYNFEIPDQDELNFQSFESANQQEATGGVPAGNQNIYGSNPYLNPSVSYSGDIYTGSGHGKQDYDAAAGGAGEFDDEPPLLEDPTRVPASNTAWKMVGVTEKTVYAEDNIIKTAPLDFQPPEGGLGHVVFEKMKALSKVIAQIDAETGEKDTYAEYQLRCVRTSLHLQDRGVKKGDILGLCSNNHLNSAVPYMASLFIGTKIACVDPTQSLAEFTHVLKLMQPKLLFTISKTAPALAKIIADNSLATVLVVFGSTSEHVDFAEFLKPHPDEDTFKPIFIEDLKETAILTFSSGSSGLPKGICLSHRAFFCQQESYSRIDNPDDEATKRNYSRLSFPLLYVNYASMCWLSAGMMAILAPIKGMGRLICNDFEPEQLWGYIDKYKPFLICLVPACAIALCRYGKPKGVSTSWVLQLCPMGCAVSKENLLMFRETFPETSIAQAYGQSETCGAFSMFKDQDVKHQEFAKNKPESSGIPLPGYTAKVVDLDTNETVGLNKRGELRIKSEVIMNGYYKQDSPDCYDEDGWFKTGDVVYFDDDFCVYIVDRIRELLKYKGFHVTPALIEIEMLNHPAVREAVVIGIPHDIDGDHPMGIVALNDNAKDITAEEIEQFVADRVLERQKLRAGVKIIDSMPLTATGKVNRRLIRNKVLAGEL